MGRKQAMERVHDENGKKRVGLIPSGELLRRTGMKFGIGCSWVVKWMGRGSCQGSPRTISEKLTTHDVGHQSRKYP